MLFIFITPVSKTTVYASDENSSSISSAVKDSVALGLRIILYPVAIVGSTVAVIFLGCKGSQYVCAAIDSGFGLEKGTSIESVKGVIKKAYITAQNGINCGLDKLNEKFTGSNSNSAVDADLN